MDEALTSTTPGVKVILQYPRQAYGEIENSPANRKKIAYYICYSNNLGWQDDALRLAVTPD